MFRPVVFCLALIPSAACQGGNSDALDGSGVGPLTDAGPGDIFSDAGDDGGSTGQTDAGAVPADANLAFQPVDCASNTDCAGEMTCSVQSPGGICNGCTEDAECGDDFECRFGACVRLCEGDLDCSPGKSCNFRGRCAQRRCGDFTPCPEPYVCPEEGFNRFCERPACGAGDTCSDGFTCSVSEQVCIEP
ncbi:MAG: hypothetical protein GY811_25190 [Myxococcales bacterium]|nr:hypothetical protein [Myxococcales bacterium]